jgi:hypothetical protein
MLDEEAGVLRGRRGAAVLDRGTLEDTIGRSSIDCSREQIGQFCTRRLWRQKVGMKCSSGPPARKAPFSGV